MNAIDLADTFMKGTEWGLRFNYLAFWTVVTAAAVTGLITTRRYFHAGFGITLLVLNIAHALSELAILGDSSTTQG
jgi:hypothetical protein